MRPIIEGIINQHGGQPKKAAIEVCRYLADTLDLAGNGWFDDDPVMRDELGIRDEPDEEWDDEEDAIE